MVVIDYDVHRFWHCPGIDRYFVSRAENVEVLAKLGESRERIAVTGIPIDPEFAATPNIVFDAMVPHAMSKKIPPVSRDLSLPQHGSGAPNVLHTNPQGSVTACASAT